MNLLAIHLISTFLMCAVLMCLCRDMYLICEESVLAFLTVEWGPVVYHLGVDFDLVDPLHVVTQLLKVPDVPVANLADHHVLHARLLLLARLGSSSMLLLLPASCC